MGALHGGGKNRITQSYGKALLYATGQITGYPVGSEEMDDAYYLKGEPKAYLVLTLNQFADTVNIDLTHLVSDSGAFVALTQTYTDAGKCGVFLTTGGETIIITGSASNNGTFTSVSATANTLVVTAGFVNEADAPSTTFKKREAHSNACVLDLNSRKGLMWSQTVSGSMGVAGDGKMPWTGVAYDIFAYCAAANTALLGGYGDWRVANKGEVESLINYETAAFDATAFPTIPVVGIWTSTTDKGTPTNAFMLWISTGNYYFRIDNAKTVAKLAWLVRGG